MAAFPGLLKRQARKIAQFEAVERYCLLNWWEERLDGEIRTTEWPGVTAISFNPIDGAYAVILFKESDSGYHAYGHAASHSFCAACQNASVELVRHEHAIRSWTHLRNSGPPKDPFENRALFFATKEGHELFAKRIRLRSRGGEPLPEIICDAEIRGSWTKYTTVWRFLFRPPSDRFMARNSAYFFW
jgi:hypothetical protein